MLVNLNDVPLPFFAVGLRDALAIPAGRAAPEERPLAHWQSLSDARFAPPPIATAYTARR